MLTRRKTECEQYRKSLARKNREKEEYRNSRKRWSWI